MSTQECMFGKHMSMLTGLTFMFIIVTSKVYPLSDSYVTVAATCVYLCES